MKKNVDLIESDFMFKGLAFQPALLPKKQGNDYIAYDQGFNE